MINNCYGHLLFPCSQTKTALQMFLSRASQHLCREGRVQSYQLHFADENSYGRPKGQQLDIFRTLWLYFTGLSRNTLEQPVNSVCQCPGQGHSIKSERARNRTPGLGTSYLKLHSLFSYLKELCVKSQIHAQRLSTKNTFGRTHII